MSRYSYWTHRPHITYNGRMESMIETIRGLLDLPSKPKILDAGCSIGLSTFEISELFPGAQLIGIDIVPPKSLMSPDSPDKYRRSLTLQTQKKSEEAKDVFFVVADMFEMPFHHTLFDMIVMSNNLMNRINNHIGFSEELFGIFRRAFEVLNEGGYLILYSDTSGLLVRQQELNTRDKKCYLLLRKVNGEPKIVGDEEFYDYYSDYDLRYFKQLFEVRFYEYLQSRQNFSET